MFIKYNGPKSVKRLSYHNRDTGTIHYTWDEINERVCQVSDAEFCRFLLHPARKGLFSRVEGYPAPKVEDAPEPTPEPKKRGRKPKKEEAK